MKAKKTIIIVIILVVIGNSSYACKCDGERTIAGSFKGSALIVHGRVLSKQLVSFAETMRANKANEVKEILKADQKKLQLFESNFIFEIKLEVVESFKGSSVRDTLTIYTTRNSSSCGYRFELGKGYIVYALKKSFQYSMFLTGLDEKESFEKDNTYWTNHCMRTTEYYKSEADELRKLKK
jgi:hypothetical protein